jgi:CubicO group peptidase (beta-lactamase class C family)
MKKINLIIILLIFSIKPFLYAQDNELKIPIDSYFKKYVSSQDRETNTPCVSIVITKQDGVLFMGNYGAANLDNRTSVTDKTIFDLASVSKQFTGMAISLLEQEGKISRNDKIIKYIPELPQIMNDITIDQLLHHTSGIRDWPVLFGLKGRQMDEQITMEQIFDLLKKQEGLNFSPGSSYLYSNSNYNLLVKIIEAVTDTTINCWMHANIFNPIGMNNTFYIEDINETIKNEAKSYAYSNQSYLQINNNLNAPGSSSLRSNMADMSKWIINFYTKRIGGDNVFDRMTQKGKLIDNKTIDYGYGLYISEINNKKVYAHDGGWAGFRTGTVYFPETGIGMVVLSNDASFLPMKAIKDIAEIIFQKSEKNETNSKSEINEDVKISDAFFSLCEGKYEQIEDKGTFLTFFKENEEYFLNFNDKKIFKLYAKSDSVLYVKEVDAEFIFHLENGKVNSHSLHQNGRYHKALKVITEQKVKEIDYKKLIGYYYSNELDVRYEVMYENNKLLIQIADMSLRIILEHNRNLTFSGNTGLIQSITFIEEENKTKGFVINNSRVKALLFKKEDE